MSLRQVMVERFSVVSKKAFEEVVKAVDAAIGHPNMAEFGKELFTAGNDAELRAVVGKAAGESGLMEFARYDLGAVLRKELGAAAPKSLRLVLGNPVTMKSMVKLVPDAGSYAPVTILIDERADGVHVSYDRMQSFLAGYGNEEALAVARDLDAKVERIIVAAAGE
jgi:uncharacterized protein (DUF302 family)